MKLETKKSLSKVMVKFFSLLTLIFGILSLFHLDNWLLRIITQASLCLMTLFNGIDTFFYKKDKSGYLFFGVAAFIFIVMLLTIFVGFDIGAL